MTILDPDVVEDDTTETAEEIAAAAAEADQKEPTLAEGLDSLSGMSDDDFAKEFGEFGSDSSTTLFQEDESDTNGSEFLGGGDPNTVKEPEESEDADGDGEADPKAEDDDPKAKAEEGDPKPNANGLTLDEFSLENLGDPGKVLEEVFAPFKADGKEVQITSAAEAIALMQKGINYSKKTAELKEQRNLLAKLSENGLMEEGVLNHLIDLHNKNPAAIAELLKESETDLLSLDVDEASKDYKPNEYNVDQQQLALKSTLQDLSTTATYDTLVAQVNDSWDTDSQQSLLNNPNSLNIISNHMEAGIYDKIVEVVDRQRTLGNISDEVPFIAAYQQIGTALEAQGAFADQGGNKAPDPDKANLNVSQQQTALKDKQTNDAKNAQRKAAAGTSASVKKAATPNDLEKQMNDLNNLSDDEFNKKYGIM